MNSQQMQPSLLEGDYSFTDDRGVTYKMFIDKYGIITIIDYIYQKQPELITAANCDKFDVPLIRARLAACQQKNKFLIADGDGKLTAVDYEQTPAQNRGERRHSVKAPRPCWQKDRNRTRARVK